MAAYDIRIIGDPVLRCRAAEIDNIDGTLLRIVDRMVETMYEADGVGLAAPQVGVQKRLFVWDVGEGPRTMVNPRIVESDGEWTYDEGCLSVPGLSWEIVRPKRVHVVGRDLDGNDMSVEADEVEARLFQHELDHLDGTLLIERLDPGGPQSGAAHASRDGDRHDSPALPRRRGRGSGREPAPSVKPPRAAR